MQKRTKEKEEIRKGEDGEEGRMETRSVDSVSPSGRPSPCGGGGGGTGGAAGALVVWMRRLMRLFMRQ